MTVKDLIELLEKFPDDYRVILPNGSDVWIKMNSITGEVTLTGSK